MRSDISKAVHELLDRPRFTMKSICWATRANFRITKESIFLQCKDKMSDTHILTVTLQEWAKRHIFVVILL